MKLIFKKISLASDHAGFTLKETIKKKLIKNKVKVLDFGPYNKDKVDYPDYAVKVCVDILLNKANFGILICGTGIGMCMAANRFSNIRAALCKDVYTACMARDHNNANVLCIGARNTEDVIPIVKTFLETKFEEEGRHRARIDKFST